MPTLPTTHTMTSPLRHRPRSEDMEAPATETDAMELDSLVPDLTAIGGQWDERIPRHHAGSSIGGRRCVAILPDRHWPDRPETCRAGHLDTVWLLNSRVLLCTGCGLDVT